MTKTQKKHHRQGPRSERKHATERSVTPSTISRIKDYSKELSKRLIHNYVLPMTRVIEHRLQRLEQSL
ncbi:MAG: hypothetical protein NDI63_13395 [Pseudobdellovibrio sp.]|nr:hypothetical protein [Pseudobdellovibrio sp.]